MIDVDGDHLEGGGQIIRTSIAMSVITSKSVRIFNIRKGRKNPGLRPQHLEAITGVARMCGASVDGLRIQSQNIIFCPGSVKGGSFNIDTQTAGSVTLVMQTLLPIAAYSDLSFQWIVKGGTAVPFSPSILYFQHVFCSYLKLMGVLVSVHVNKHGFYPAGGGEISVSVIPGQMKDIEITQQGRLDRIDVFSQASFHLKEKRVAERMTKGFKKVIPKANFETSYINSLSPGCSVTALATYSNGVRIGACTLGEIRKEAEHVGYDAAQHLKDGQDSGAAIDCWMVDQIIPYMALAVIKTGSLSRIRVPSMTSHAETNIWVVKKFLPVEFEVKENILTCHDAH